MNLDAQNLHGWAMPKYLARSNFVILEYSCWEMENFNVCKVHN